jgi:hypothetical protein
MPLELYDVPDARLIDLIAVVQMRVAREVEFVNAVIGKCIPLVGSIFKGLAPGITDVDRSQ